MHVSAKKLKTHIIDIDLDETPEKIRVGKIGGWDETVPETFGASAL